MGRNTRLWAVMVLLALLGALVWQLSLGGGAPVERADPARAAVPPEEKAPEPSPAPVPEPAPESTAEILPPPAKDGGIRVRVLAEGKPVTDALVHAHEGDTLHELGHEADGVYFAAATGEVTVGAMHPRFGPARREIDAPKGAITEVTLELPAGETLDVRVLAGKGDTPVAGASVHVIRAGGPGLDGSNTGLESTFFQAEEDEEEIDFGVLGALDFNDLLQLGGLPAVAIPVLVTAADGRVRIEGLPKGTVDLVVTHKDFIATRLTRQPVGKEAVARLAAGGSLTVLAPYVEGRAAEGYLCGAIRPGLMLSMPVAAATVDAEGKAHFAHLPPGPLRIVVAKVKHPMMLMGFAMGGMVVTSEEGEVPAEGEEEPQPPKAIADARVTIVSGEHRTLDLREAKGTRIEGVFVAGEDARAGAAVLLLSGDRQVGVRMTDAKGEFSFDAVEPGMYRVTAAGGAGGIARADVEVKEGDEVLKVRLEFPAGAIAGRVLGADGKPAKEARVLVAPKAGGGQVSNLADLMEQLAGYAETDEEGRFRVPGIAPGEYKVLGAVGRRLDVAHVALREREEAQVELRMDDARVRRLLVRIEGPGGKPAEGSVDLLGADGGAAETLALTPDDEILEPKDSATHEFFLAPGRYRLVVQAHGLAPALGEIVEISGDRELTVKLVAGVRVDLVFEGPGGPMANRDVDVRNEHGIRLDAQSGLAMLFGGHGFRTDGAGALALEAVPPGRYVVSVDGKERGRIDVAGTPVTKRFRIE